MSKNKTRPDFFQNTPTGEEDRRVRRTKRLLKESLIELIAEKGYDEVSVQEVIDRADVGRTSFYTYFRSKEDLLLRSLDDLGQLLDTVSVSSGSSPLDFILEFFRHLEENRDLAKALLGNRGAPFVREHVQSQFMHHFQKVFQNKSIGRNSGKTGDRKGGGLQVDGAAAFASGALLSTILWWLACDRPASPEAMDEMIHKLLDPGIRAFFST